MEGGRGSVMAISGKLRTSKLPSMSPRLAFAVDAVHRAGRSTLAHFQAGVAVDVKEDRSPVTVADRQAERMIREAIESAYPGEAILGEEEGASPGATNSGAPQRIDGDAVVSDAANRRWVVDPIDGTKSFVSGVPMYATLLSWEVGGVAELGVCYFPALELMLWGERGAGAMANGRPCRVSSRPTVEGSVLCCGGHASMAKTGRMQPFLKLAERTMATRTWCDAYGHALVAMGQVDAMIDPVIAHWDISAMSVIVEEAGGRFTNFDGVDGLFGEALSSNGLLHDELVEAFRA